MKELVFVEAEHSMFWDSFDMIRLTIYVTALGYTF